MVFIGRTQTVGGGSKEVKEGRRNILCYVGYSLYFAFAQFINKNNTSL